MTTKKTLDILAEFDFSVEAPKVYDGWLDEKLMQKWFGPGIGKTQPVKIEPNVGGRFRIVQIRNNQAVSHSGENLALERPKHLSFTWETDDFDDVDVISIRIEAHESGSKVKLIHTIDAQYAAFAEEAKSAWLSMMEKMNALLQ
jgi:uncharacterized protein YndB with AHSA1/START domain